MVCDIKPKRVGEGMCVFVPLQDEDEEVEASGSSKDNGAVAVCTPKRSPHHASVFFRGPLHSRPEQG